MADKCDIHQVITDKLIAAMEAGAGKWRMPWVQPGGGVRPKNVSSGKSYNGVNVLALWVDAMAKGYGSNVWGTFNQWKEKGAQVRKGEKSSLVVFYKNFLPKGSAEGDPMAMVARATPVFNADQVDGWTPPVPAEILVTGAERIAAADLFIRNTGAEVVMGGAQAFYRPSTDTVHMPEMDMFHGSDTSTPTEAFYSTHLHELVHWSGAKPRLGRDLSGRFKSEPYAMEELVAEIGAAFLCAELGISIEPRADHAQYLSSWIRVLKDDKKAVFTASSQASKAFDFLVGLQSPLAEIAAHEAAIAA